MARIRFTADFDYRPNGRSLIAYKAGKGYTVKRACADQAVAAGKGYELQPKPAPATPKPVRRRRKTAA